MALTPSTMLELGTQAPDFTLPDTEGEPVSLKSFAGKDALVVMFICVHCPYVKHVQDELAELAKDYQAKNVGFVAIMSNDVEKYPDDSPKHMAHQKKEHGFPFPYLYDETQQVAKDYRAACTPDFYVFDKQRKLAYRGQLDDTRPNAGHKPDGRDLRAALDAILEGKDTPEQKPSIGCNIKWRIGNEPDYFTA
ncbi:thioredoxin family protein [Phycisphaerales bacterium AB-hyl4]|uniref:Thioredoxin family protein n=1 Tax=Natronomicrosphaera hydrolytica TaxID=3242702 RepID=A0ABV4U4C9_9BACT